MSAMRKIQPAHIHAKPQQVAHRRLRMAGWTNRTNDLCAAAYSNSSGRERWRRFFRPEGRSCSGFQLGQFHRFKVVPFEDLIVMCEEGFSDRFRDEWHY